jgi:hypothetical protein
LVLIVVQSAAMIDTDNAALKIATGVISIFSTFCSIIACLHSFVRPNFLLQIAVWCSRDSSGGLKEALTHVPPKQGLSSSSSDDIDLS